MKKLVIIGAGGYAKSVIDSLLPGQYELCGFVDLYKAVKGDVHLGYPILTSSIQELPNPERYCYFICIGNNMDRKSYFDYLIENNYEVISVVDRTAMVSSNSKLGTGVFIGKLAIVNSGAVVGNNSILNTRSLTEHGCCIGSHVNLSTNAVINGDVVVEDGSFIGSCSVVNGQVRIGAWATIGSGAVVVRNVSPHDTVVGIPAKSLKRRSS